MPRGEHLPPQPHAPLTLTRGKRRAELRASRPRPDLTRAPPWGERMSHLADSTPMRASVLMRGRTSAMVGAPRRPPLLDLKQASEPPRCTVYALPSSPGRVSHFTGRWALTFGVRPVLPWAPAVPTIREGDPTNRSVALLLLTIQGSSPKDILFQDTAAEPHQSAPAPRPPARCAAGEALPKRRLPVHPKACYCVCLGYPCTPTPHSRPT